jgi:hypothetical protein
MPDTDKPGGKAAGVEPAAQPSRATRRSTKTDGAEPEAQPTPAPRRRRPSPAKAGTTEARTAEGGEPTRTSAELAELERLRARLVMKSRGRR